MKRGELDVYPRVFVQPHVPYINGGLKHPHLVRGVFQYRLFLDRKSICSRTYKKVIKFFCLLGKEERNFIQAKTQTIQTDKSSFMTLLRQASSSRFDCSLREIGDKLKKEKWQQNSEGRTKYLTVSKPTQFVLILMIRKGLDVESRRRREHDL